MLAYTPVHDSSRGLLTARAWCLYGLGLALLCMTQYAPGFDNGFISDDYVLLEYSTRFLENPAFLFTVPPQNFRLTTYAAFAGLRAAFGYNAAAFYAFNLTLHVVCALLLTGIVLRLTGNSATAILSGIIFAVFHGPQEAVLWLAAMGETLSGFFLLLAVLLWVYDHRLLGLLPYTLALFSKESAPVLVAALPWIQWQRGEPLFPRAWLAYLLPTAAFGWIFLATLDSNSMVHNGFYAFGLHSFPVFLRTLNRLLWPWLYIALAIWAAHRRRRPDWRAAARWVAGFAAVMAPYAFVTYAGALQSRHLYFSTALFAPLLAWIVLQLPRRGWMPVFLAAFLICNVGYVWWSKDEQFENRAAPTTELLLLLQAHPPAPVLIHDFPYYEPTIARDVALLVPGWQREFIRLSHVGESCEACVELRWDAERQVYDGGWK